SDEILHQLLVQSPLPLESREPGVPRDLAAIVRKAIARNPQERYPTAKELADDLRKFQTGQLVSAHEYTAFALGARWLRRDGTEVAGRAFVQLTFAVVYAVVRMRAVREIEASVRSHLTAAERALSEARAGNQQVEKLREDALALFDQNNPNAAEPVWSR